MFSAKQTLRIEIDPRKLASRMHKESVKALFRSGAILRKSMRNLIRRTKKKKSKPGDPPKDHTVSGEFGLKSIVYQVDKDSLSMRVGPIIESQKDLPGLLEKGGVTTFKLLNGRFVRARIAARPFSSVALENFIGAYPELWRNVIK